ncbi:permease-like cell division protein FtsX [Tissierella sp. Yu-01]|uniref:cell division protein FtsX n=1 Tax=Tissierella sp. Yu-01 TaxID=3035694 RepID=UPI00240E62A2|nr:permease-like cell division protein FtsX [Tissierella sp. Yu-01]WFA10145.1 permease-like cell division protein FtsX [Tissierella sp. Yu-01]
MKVIFRNTGYFFREIKTIVKLDFLSNIFSIISLSFIFFLLSLIFSGGWITNDLIKAIENEAEISVYYNEEINVVDIENRIKKVTGVKEVNYIDENKAKSEMTEIMGEESRILELFDHNPFDPYIEVKIDLNYVESISEEVELINGIELVRDNKEILDKLKDISSLITILGLILIIAVSISTLVITSHIIRQGINSNKEQIYTLRLLGAPESFITLPFILEGLFMTILAGIISLIMIFVVINYIYAKIMAFLPFLILPNMMQMMYGIGIIGILLSFTLGLLGSLFGINSTKK